MAQLVILGAGTSVPDATHDLSSLALVTEHGAVLIDCGGSPLRNLNRANIDPLSVNQIILTHAHPDHTSGLPPFIVGLWILGRTEPLLIYGLPATLAVIRDLLAVYRLDNRWPALFPLEFRGGVITEPTPLFTIANVDIHAAAGRHSRSTIGVRFTNRNTKRAIVFTSDTEPCPTMTALAQGADVLIHEANFLNVAHIQANRQRIGGGVLANKPYGNVFHSCAADAGRVAREAQVGKLVLMHCEPSFAPLTEFVKEAQTEFSGAVELAQDYAVYEL